MKLVCFGLSHKSAPVDVREQMAVARDDLPGVLQKLCACPEVGEAVVVSTCNRVEAYAMARPGVAVEDLAATVFDFFAREKRIPTEKLARHTYSIEGVAAVEHLFRVSSSLESLVVGEPQILGQVKEAFGGSCDAGTVGTELRALFDRAFRTAKRVRTETQVAAGAISVSWVAVELARRIFERLDKCSVMVIGAGEMAELAAQNLEENGASNVYIANRSYERAVKLADAHGWQARAFGDLPFLLEHVDIVISSTGSPVFVIEPELIEKVMRRRKYRALFLVDIAVPRDVDPRVGEIENVYLYNVDDLEQITRKNQEDRQREVDKAVVVVRDEVQRHGRWMAEATITPTIASLRKRVMAIREAELERSDKTLRTLSDDQRAVVERMTMAMVNKFLHEPTVRLKRESSGVDGQRLVEAVRDLFALPAEEPEPPVAAPAATDERDGNDRAHGSP